MTVGLKNQVVLKDWLLIKASVFLSESFHRQTLFQFHKVYASSATRSSQN